MTSIHASDHTRSLFVVLLSITVGGLIIATLLGFSEKPRVDHFVVRAPFNSLSLAAQADDPSLAGESVEAADENLNIIGAEPDAAAKPLDTQNDSDLTVQADSGQAVAGSDQADGQALGNSALVAETTQANQPDSVRTGDLDQADVSTQEIVPAVAPTPNVAGPASPEASNLPADGESAPVLAASMLGQTVPGSFFTKPDEEAGAVVSYNKLDILFNADGTGLLTAGLEIAYANKTAVSINMNGPFNWTVHSPQVDTTVGGSYFFDAELDAEDVSADTASLKISSIPTGSGALCTPKKCFGFTFPPS